MEKFEKLLLAMETWKPEPDSITGGEIKPEFLWSLRNWQRKDLYLENVTNFLQAIYDHFLATGDVELFANCLDVLQQGMKFLNRFHPKSEDELVDYFVENGVHTVDFAPKEFSEISWKRVEAIKVVLDAAGVRSETIIFKVYDAPDGDLIWYLPGTILETEDLKAYAGGNKVAVARLFADFLEATLPYGEDNKFWEQRRQQIRLFREAGRRWEGEN